MPVTFNSISPKYNGYKNNYNNNNAAPYNYQPSFGANTEEVVVKVAKKSKFLSKISNFTKKFSDKLAEGFATIIPKVFDNKLIDKVTTKLQDTDNLFKHFLAIGSAITSVMYMYKTLTNDKLDKDRKNTLAVNQFLTFALSTAGAYTLDSSINDWWQKQTAKYASHSLEDKTIYTDFVEQFDSIKAENKEIKKFNKSAAAVDKKDLKSIKVDDFIKERLNKYLTNKSDKDVFMNRIKGMGLLKSMLIFALVYRYIVPVAVTKPANILCDKYLAYKKSKESQNTENTTAQKA